ncbi:MAG: nucleotidyltransferase domain-containing protein [Acidobacteriota bacterium]|nr:nucleotidyltransferase domain-containing protein [Acidobacteriota bacterium]
MRDVTMAVSHPDLQILLDQLRQAMGAHLRSVVLYGSATRGDYERATSDLNLLVVLDELTPERLEQASPALTRWESRRQPLPRLFTLDALADSADVFPIELLDLKARRQVLVGEDPFETLEVHTTHLRLQCERELREKLMRLQEGYVECHASPRQLRRLLTDSYTTFVALFRGCLWLHSDPVPDHNEEVVAQFCRAAGLDPVPFDIVARMKHGEPPATEERKVFARYYAELMRAVSRVDRFAKEGGDNR